jgi:hypothetical protein
LPGPLSHWRSLSPRRLDADVDILQLVSDAVALLVTNHPVVSAGPTNGPYRGAKGGVTITAGLPPGGSQGGFNGTHGGGIGQGSNRGTYNYPGGTVRDHRSH